MHTCNCHPAPSADAGLTLAITTVPMQPWEVPYDPQKALKQGTIFPGLDKPFYVTAEGSANIPAGCACHGTGGPAAAKGGVRHG